ncbi:hypothetical protein A2303_07775 [Candidatus Falkowbacteria bacterium RIFOXYB2_FULL_47_14]|uniref:CYTH domain-containing protein n=1 Tax=Candidatus Falkowbacteria bacterium RIFOXYA2_FULL_47_19 TaxID=1797994 RepID=A0A1F5SMI4_9BACT|nr:MAG: hypothetical protein A2227_04920 [Candidatus Falkowbacteria bacterium RIFOXYA2_FULL_47_19]OGF36027.1 MAG: hypothetical protein A2468_00625 [Candidatus Falkowbacteria bacterium RIFOXYC2_FULL_46_15]OGF43417.1 MAG: hypothetical protein A2303_07775 [Candidatus Falkowbacteria bacterium RIFOXYB2_FULL_47_14]
MPLEIERKFLVEKLPDGFDRHDHVGIIQGYLAIAADGTEVRLRKRGDKYYLTVKTGAGEVRSEREIRIREEQFLVLWPAVGAKTLIKDRYCIPHGDLTFELDVYRNTLNGLMTVEVEFKDKKTSRAFEPPDWFGQEVTHDRRYKNQSLVLYGRPYK